MNNVLSWCLIHSLCLTSMAGFPFPRTLKKENKGLKRHFCTFGKMIKKADKSANYLDSIGVKLVARDGIEPPTRGFSVHCSTN